MSELTVMLAATVLAIASGAGAAQAAAPAVVPPAPSAHALGVAESLLHYCARVDAKAAVAVRGRIDGMLKGSTAAAVAGLRRSPDYQSAYTAVTTFVGKVDPHNATRPCDEFLASTAPVRR